MVRNLVVRENLKRKEVKKLKTKIFLSSLIVMLIAVIVCFNPISAHAIPFQEGDVFAATSSGTVQHWRVGSGLLATYSTGQGGFETGMAFDSSNNLYVTNFSASNITKLDNTGTIIASPFVTNDSYSNNESIVFDTAGNFYVGQPDGTRDIIKRAADGTFLARYDVSSDNRGSDWIDLAADQSTMYYTSEGRLIQRYDVSTDTQLTAFATLPGDGRAFALRLLADGGLLVADQSNIKRLDSTGALIQTYDVAGNNGWFALNIDPNGTSFWSADDTTGLIQQFDITSGAIGTSFASGVSEGPYGLVILGEVTQASSVPEPSTLILLGSGVVGLAFARRKKSK